MIHDIVEREVKAPKPPKIQDAKPSLWGARKKGMQSKQAKTATNEASAQPQPPAQPQPQPRNSDGHKEDALTEEEKIHLKNLQVLNKMSPAEIEKQKQQLIDTMDPKVLQALLKRAELKEGQHATPTPKSMKNAGSHAAAPAAAPAAETATPPTVAADEANVVESCPNPDSVSADQRNASEPVQQSQNPAQNLQAQPHTEVHFPSAPEELKKYFPELPVETAKMAWMQPVDPEEEAEYSSELVSVAPSQLRFDFNGDLLTPRTSAALDTNLGLHHHADAPGAAGYTIPELAHLARSTHSSQRTIAIRTIGRVLHKLANGKFNKSSELQYALEQLVKSTRIEETLLEAASDQTRSLTVRTHATEALWLYHNRA